MLITFLQRSLSYKKLVYHQLAFNTHSNNSKSGMRCKIANNQLECVFQTEAHFIFLLHWNTYLLVSMLVFWVVTPCGLLRTLKQYVPLKQCCATFLHSWHTKYCRRVMVAHQRHFAYCGKGEDGLWHWLAATTSYKSTPTEECSIWCS
jgi:hypothetical protein